MNFETAFAQALQNIRSEPLRHHFLFTSGVKYKTFKCDDGCFINLYIENDGHNELMVGSLQAAKLHLFFTQNHLFSSLAEILRQKKTRLTIYCVQDKSRNLHSVEQAKEIFPTLPFGVSKNIAIICNESAVVSFTCGYIPFTIRFENIQIEFAAMSTDSMRNIAHVVSTTNILPITSPVFVIGYEVDMFTQEAIQDESETLCVILQKKNQTNPTFFQDTDLVLVFDTAPCLH